MGSAVGFFKQLCMTFKLHYLAYLGHTNNYDLLKEHAVV
jgi:hypothetical protein